MLILPAIDLLGGRCVRLFQGDYRQETVYDEDPCRVAQEFAMQGAEILHVVDLDGARSGTPANLELVSAICHAVKIPVQFGGGVRSLDTARRALDLGVHRVVIGSKLLAEPEFAEAIFAALGESAAAGIDAREGRVAVSGWTEHSDVAAEDLARRIEALGAHRFIVTDIARDGALRGPNLDFLRTMAGAVRGKVIASGGVSSLEDIRAIASLQAPNLEGVIVGRAIYEGKFTVVDAVGLDL